LKKQDYILFLTHLKGRDWGWPQ